MANQGARPPPPPPGVGGRPPGPPPGMMPDPAQQPFRIPRRSDLTQETPLSESECRKRLTEYSVFTLHKPESLGHEKTSWRSVDRVEESYSQEDIRAMIRNLDLRSQRSVPEKKGALYPNQHTQVTKLLDELKMQDRNQPDFETTIAQIDTVTRSVKNAPIKRGVVHTKETATITIYVKRAPRPGVNAMTLFNNIEQQKRFRPQQQQPNQGPTGMPQPMRQGPGPGSFAAMPPGGPGPFPARPPVGQGVQEGRPVKLGNGGPIDGFIRVSPKKQNEKKAKKGGKPKKRSSIDSDSDSDSSRSSGSSSRSSNLSDSDGSRSTSPSDFSVLSRARKGRSKKPNRPRIELSPHRSPLRRPQSITPPPDLSSLPIIEAYKRGLADQQPQRLITVPRSRDESMYVNVPDSQIKYDERPRIARRIIDPRNYDPIPRRIVYPHALEDEQRRAREEQVGDWMYEHHERQRYEPFNRDQVLRRMREEEALPPRRDLGGERLRRREDAAFPRTHSNDFRHVDSLGGIARGYATRRSPSPLRRFRPR